jgi:hypothetical protein
LNNRYLNKLGIEFKQKLDVVSEGSFDEEESEENNAVSRSKASGD